MRQKLRVYILPQRIGHLFPTLWSSDEFGLKFG